MPDLIGATRDDAIAQLDALGLRAEVQEEGDLLDELLGGDWIVCESTPGLWQRRAEGGPHPPRRRQGLLSPT